MHHLYPSVKGDPLCPLGFHPQVRWPTRCKRCFRDYKEHGGKKKDDDYLRKDETTASSPSLSIWSSSRKDDSNSDISRRSWTSSSNMAKEEIKAKEKEEPTNFFLRRPASWTSTPDLGNLKDDTAANIPTFSITLPKRKPAPADTGQKTLPETKPSPKTEENEKKEDKSPVFNKNDSLATRARKLKASKESSASKKDNASRRIQVKELKAAVEEPTNHDVQFLIQVKSKTFNKNDSSKNEKHFDDDVSSIAGTETTDTTLVGNANENELQEQIESFKQELDILKQRCEKAEREKSDILLRRLAEKDTTSSRTTATEMLRLQQKYNEMQAQLEDLQDDKKSLSLKVKELENELENRPTSQSVQKMTDELRSKLLAAETLCEELMDENEDMKKELRDMEEEMEEMQDNFREDQADEYTSLKKELEQTTKNCRILSFKLRKTERKVEQLESEKQEAEKKLKEVSDGQSVLERIERIKHLEQELKVSNEVSLRLQKELEEAKTKISKVEETQPGGKKKAPMLSAIGKLSSGDGKMSRASLTRGGSQDDPVQLLRDLQDSLEREADLREQLKFAEEELEDTKKPDLSKLLKPRTPKKPTALTTSSQLKTWVLDLEKEITEYTTALQTTESARLKLESEYKSSNGKTISDDVKKLGELDDLKKTVTVLEKKVTEYKANISKEKSKQDDLNNNLTKQLESVKKLQLENSKLKSESEKVLQEKKKMEQQIDNLNIKLESVQKKQKETQEAVSKAENLQTELNEKRKEITALKKEIDSLKEEKPKLDKQLIEKSNKLSEIESRVKEVEEKMKTNEKLLSSKKVKISRLEKELEAEKQKIKDKETDWSLEKSSLEATIAAKNATIEDMNRRESSTPNALSNVQEELTKAKGELIETKCNLENMVKSKKTIEEKLSKIENELKTEKSNWEKKVSSLESDLQTEKKKFDRMKANQEKEQKNRELELSTLKMKIHSLEQRNGGNEKLSSVKQEYEDRIAKLTKQITDEKKEYDDLTGKYEILEEEHVVTKAQLVMEKEAINSQLTSTREELTSLEKELRNLRDTYTSQSDSWIKEKLSLEDQIKEFRKKATSGSNTNDSLALERTRLKASLQEKTSEIDQLKRESEVIEDQLKNLRKENEDLKQKLDDFDKVSKVQRNINADSSALDKEVVQLKNKLTQVEKSRKADLAETKMRYDSQVAVISEELQSLQNQVTRFKRERDTYKHMLEGAQKTLGDLKMAASKTDREKHNSESSVDEIEEQRMKVQTLDQQISCMEDELSEARLESSKLKTELVSERSSWEVKLSEMRSKVNELEEERLLSSGRTKVAGLRTRMELAWQKEREEQTRLLQETSTLARDLRQTLFEVERERDKERLEAKRKQDQLKKTAEEEQEENRRKLNELQCDLLELRDAHAKLRTTNEKLRREKERNEKDREELRAAASRSKKSDFDEDRRVAILLEQVDILLKSMPELPPDVYTPTPPRRTKSKSRESSPAFSRETSRERSVGRADDMHVVIQRLKDATQEIRTSRTRRSVTMRRAASTENDSTDQYSRQLRNGSLNPNRKSLSLEQTAGQLDQNFWKGDDNSLSSLQSLDTGSDVDSRFYSMDSRLSGGSTQSEMIPGGPDKKKKKGIMGKLRKLTKSRSIEDQNYQPGGTDSVASDTDIRGSKKDLKERLTGMFKRSGSSSRSNSVERSKERDRSKTREEQKVDSSSMQRPLMRNVNGSSSNRPSPSPSERSTSLNRDVYKYK